MESNRRFRATLLGGAAASVIGAATLFAPERASSPAPTAAPAATAADLFTASAARSSADSAAQPPAAAAFAATAQPNTAAAGQPPSAAAAQPPAAAATPLTAEKALARVVRMPWARDPLPPKESVDEARRVLEAAAAREPGNAKWAFGLAHAARLEARFLAGDAAAGKRKEAKERFAKLVEREPASADDNYWLGDTCFEMIDDVGTLSKPSLASQGRKAFEKAIALDPSHAPARYALGIFYERAPGIVGGSTAKAKEQGEALLKLPADKGVFWGRMLLGRIAAGEKNWEEMSRQYTAAEKSAGNAEETAAALQTHANGLLSDKKDPASALPVIVRSRAGAQPDDYWIDFMEGEARRQLGQWSEAAVLFERVLAKNPEARNTRFGIAECYEKLGKHAEARKHYEEFVRRFPKEERASKAREAVKRLS